MQYIPGYLLIPLDVKRTRGVNEQSSLSIESVLVFVMKYSMVLKNVCFEGGIAW